MNRLISPQQKMNAPSVAWVIHLKYFADEHSNQFSQNEARPRDYTRQGHVKIREIHFLPAQNELNLQEKHGFGWRKVKIILLPIYF